jgi:hypothetical protein
VPIFLKPFSLNNPELSGSVQRLLYVCLTLEFAIISQAEQFIWNSYMQYTVYTISPTWAMNHSRPAHFCRRHNLKTSQVNLCVRTAVVKSYVGSSVVLGQVRVAILHDQPSSHLLLLQTIQRSLRIQILRTLPADKVRRVGHSVSHVPVRDAANFCGGQMDERAALASPSTALALNK